MFRSQYMPDLICIRFRNSKWYKGRIIDVYHGGSIDVMYEDGDVDYGLHSYNVVPFKPYRPNDLVEVKIFDDWRVAKVMKMIGYQ